MILGNHKINNGKMHLVTETQQHKKYIILWLEPSVFCFVFICLSIMQVKFKEYTTAKQTKKLVVRNSMVLSWGKTCQVDVEVHLEE